MKKIRVLIVDDSALIRKLLTSLLSSDPEIEVIGTAPDPYIARDKIKALDPDVLTLDVEMPRMDGLTFLEKLMAGHPMPVLMVSSLTQVGCETTMRAMELGAIDFFTKPKFDMEQGIGSEAEILIEKVKAAAKANIIGLRKNRVKRVSQKSLSSSAMSKTTDTIIAVGASTGGTEAIRDLLLNLPPNTPPMLITQHMPERFTKTFADRLNKECKLTVKEGEDGDSVIAGRVLIAPGNYHMQLRRSGARYEIKLNQGELVNRHRPAVDVLFHSVAEYAGKNVIGVILTGMGGDGAKGMLEMKKRGAYNIAQDEKTSVVFGMPKVAIEQGGTHEVTPLHDIPASILRHLPK